jgi:hypothetical protein
MGEIKYACILLVGKPQGKRPLERRRHRLEGSIKMEYKVL